MNQDPSKNYRNHEKPNRNYWLDIANDSSFRKPGETRRIIYWYLFFIVVIPIIFVHLFSFDHLRYYLSVVDIIANIFASVRRGKWMGRLFSLLPQDIVSYMSTNFLSLLAITGSSWTAIKHAIETKNVFSGVVISVILFIFTYLIPVQGVSFFMNRSEEYVEDSWMTDFLVGFSFLLFVLLIEKLIIFNYMKMIKKI
jgi:hypothetical protein